MQRILNTEAWIDPVENSGLGEAGIWGLSPSRPLVVWAVWWKEGSIKELTVPWRSPQEREGTSECFERLGREGEAAV